MGVSYFNFVLIAYNVTTMKRKLLTLCSLATMFVAQNAIAEDVVLNNTTAVELNSGAVDYNIYSTFASGNPKIGVAGETYNVGSITLAPAGVQVPGEAEGVLSTNPNDVYFYGNYNFDINQSEGEKVIIDNQSKKRFYCENGTTLTITNSATPSTAENAIAPVAVIDLGSGDGTARSLMMYNNVNITFKTNSRIESDVVTARTWYPVYIYGNNANLSVENASTLTINTNTRIGDGKKTPTISVSDGSTLLFNNAEYLNPATGKKVAAGYFDAYSGTITVDETSKLQVKQSARFGVAEENIVNGQKPLTATINGTFDMDSSVTINKTASFVVKNFEHANGSLLSVYGSFETQKATVFANTTIYAGGTVQQTSGDKTTFQRDVTLSNGGTFKTTGVLYLEAGSTDETNSKWATVTIDDGANFYVDGKASTGTAVILKNGELILNKENAITTSDGKIVQMESADSGTNIIIRVNASQEFTKLVANTFAIDYYMGDATDTLTADFGTISTGQHVFHNFNENQIFINNWETTFLTSESLNNAFAAYQTINGEEVKIDTLYINNGWLSAINPAVPEPAEWAMIFGGIALGLAIYRKRK